MKHICNGCIVETTCTQDCKKIETNRKNGNLLKIMIENKCCPACGGTVFWGFLCKTCKRQYKINFIKGGKITISSISKYIREIPTVFGTSLDKSIQDFLKWAEHEFELSVSRSKAGYDFLTSFGVKLKYKIEENEDVPM